MLVIIIDGIEQQTANDEYYDWLPIHSPKSVKLIYSCNKDSSAYRYIKCGTYTEINVDFPDPRNKYSLTLHFSKSLNSASSDRIAKEIKKYGITKNALHNKFLYNIVSSCFASFPQIQIHSLENLRTIHNLFEFTVDMIASFLQSDDPYKFFSYLQASPTGLTELEMFRLLGDSFQVNPYLRFFKFMLVNNNQRYFLSNTCFKVCVFSKYHKKSNKIHSDLANALEDLNPSRVGEIAFHICKSKDRIRLKNYLSQITVFSEMIKVENLIVLYRYWLKLEKCKFDSVSCYSKSLEAFSKKNQLPPHDILILLVLLSTFFIEMSEFEKKLIIKFEHPSLVGYYELKEIEILDEFVWLGNIFDQSYNFKDEEIIFSENLILREKYKEKIRSNDDPEINLIATNEYYHYKRWLWVQFPWCALDTHSSFSKILKHLREEPDIHFQNLFASIERIVNSSKDSEEISIFHDRTKPLKMAQHHHHSFSIQPKHFEIFSAAEPVHSFDNTICQPILRRPKDNELFKRKKLYESTQNLSLQGLRPENALGRVQSIFQAFSTAKIRSKIKETQDLKDDYNKKVYEYNVKKQRFESISSQIEKSNSLILATEKSSKKISILQEKFSEMCSKLNNIEAETSRYYQIIDCCFKNPARNDEWERKLNKRIDSIAKLIEYEKKDIVCYEKDVESIEVQIKELQIISDEKLRSEHKTLDKVLEQFLIKSHINEKLFNMEAKRQEIVSGTYFPIDYGILHSLKDQEEEFSRVKQMATNLNDKLEFYKENIEKLSQAGAIKKIEDLPEILLKLNRRVELNQTRIKLEEKLERLEKERRTLASKLDYLETKEKRYSFMNCPEKIDSLTKLLRESQKKCEAFQAHTVNQEVLLSTCQINLSKLWAKLGIAHTFNYRPEYISIIFSQIKAKIQILEDENTNTLHVASYRSNSPSVTSTRYSLNDILSFNNFKFQQLK